MSEGCHSGEEPEYDRSNGTEPSYSSKRLLSVRSQRMALDVERWTANALARHKRDEHQASDVARRYRLGAIAGPVPLPVRRRNSRWISPVSQETRI